MKTPSPAQRRLIAAVARAVQAANGDRVVLGDALTAAEEPFNGRTRDACVREGWLDRRVSPRPPTYLVTPAGYASIGGQA